MKEATQTESLIKGFQLLVGAPGLEPGVAPSQTEYVSQLHHAPTKGWKSYKHVKEVETISSLRTLKEYHIPTQI